jgi:hypothetical protein
VREPASRTLDPRAEFDSAHSRIFTQIDAMLAVPRYLIKTAGESANRWCKGDEYRLSRVIP